MSFFWPRCCLKRKAHAIPEGSRSLASNGGICALPSPDPAHGAAYDAAYDVLFLDGPYDHDETPDGAVRLALDPGFEAARLAAAHAAVAAGHAEFRSSESPVTLDYSTLQKRVF